MSDECGYRDDDEDYESEDRAEERRWNSHCEKMTCGRVAVLSRDPVTKTWKKYCSRHTCSTWAEHWDAFEQDMDLADHGDHRVSDRSRWQATLETREGPDDGHVGGYGATAKVAVDALWAIVVAEWTREPNFWPPHCAECHELPQVTLDRKGTWSIYCKARTCPKHKVFEGPIRADVVKEWSAWVASPVAQREVW